MLPSFKNVAYLLGRGNSAVNIFNTGKACFSLLIHSWKLQFIVQLTMFINYLNKLPLGLCWNSKFNKIDYSTSFKSIFACLEIFIFSSLESQVCKGFWRQNCGSYVGWWYWFSWSAPPPRAADVRQEGFKITIRIIPLECLRILYFNIDRRFWCGVSSLIFFFKKRQGIVS